MPQNVNGFEVFSATEMPAARPQQPRRGAKRKYPWWEMAPGFGFRFGADVIEQSARVQASNMSHSTNREFKVYTGEDGFLWCVRIDGVPRSAWPDIPRQRRLEVEPTPAGELSPSVMAIDETFANANPDGGGGTPVFGNNFRDSDFEAPADDEWSQRAAGAVEPPGDKEII